MSRATILSIRGLACALLILVGGIAVQGAGEPAAVTKGKKLIAANAE